MKEVTDTQLTMKNLYILHHDKPRKVTLQEFVRHCQTVLEDQGLEASDERVMAALAVIRSDRSPWQMDDGTVYAATEEEQKFFLVMKSCHNASQALHRQESKSVPTPRTRVEGEQQALLKADETIQAIKEEAIQGANDRLRGIVERNFDVLECGGLVLKAGATLTPQEALETLGGFLAYKETQEKEESSSNLGLADLVGTIEEKFGESLDYTQIVQDHTGKSQSLISQARMVYHHFPGRKRQSLDPEGRMTYSHYVSACKKKLSGPEKEALIRFAVKRSEKDHPVSATKLGALANLVGEYPELERMQTIEKLDASGLPTDACLAAMKLDRSGAGEEKARWLYIYQKDDSIALKCSNEWDSELDLKAVMTVRLNGRPTLRQGPDTFDPIDFTYVAPDIQEDPRKPEVAYGDFKVYQEGESFLVTGTVNGQVVAHDAAFSTQSQAIDYLRTRYGVGPDNRDKKGRIFNIRHD